MKSPFGEVGTWLPIDIERAVLVGRIQTPAGPSPVLVRLGRIWDMSAAAPTVSELLVDWSGIPDGGRDLGAIGEFDFSTQPLLPPVDLQCLKAAGVTFAVSAVERVIEERARGDA